MSMELQSINPYTEEVMSKFEYSKIEDILDELKRLKENDFWHSISVKERSEVVRKVAKELKKEKEENSKLISSEMGKPIKESIQEIEKCVLLCEYFADNAEKFLQDEFIETEHTKSYVTLDPLGVVLGIMPWNFPFWQVFRFAIPTLLIGNRIVIKHSSNVPQCALKIEEIFHEALPENVYKNVFIQGGKVTKLIDSRYVDGTSITGSVLSGAKVAEVAGKNIKKSVLELGGSDPFIVLEDADLNNCCQQASIARFRNAGQSCTSAKRFIIQKEILADFLQLFIENINMLKLGDPLDKETDIGPLARNDLRTQLHDIVRRSIDMGAKIITGGGLKEGRGYFYEPTVLTNVNETMPVLREETFGPVAPIVVVKDEEEAIKMANNTEYGLGASLWTENINKSMKLVRRIEAGFIAINGMVRSDPRLPFGGIKKSGYGRELSYQALREFANVKTVVIR